MTQRARPPRSHGHHTNQLHGQRRKSGIRHQSSMQKVTPGQAVSFVPQHTTSQRSKRACHAFCFSSFFLMAAPLSAYAASLHCAKASFRSAATHPNAASVLARLRPQSDRRWPHGSTLNQSVLSHSWTPSYFGLSPAGFLRTRKTARRKALKLHEK
jgi:hypothetical protein